MTRDEARQLFPGGPRRQPHAFRLGDAVRILSGPFASFTGHIEGINQARALLKVKVSIFGAGAPVKLRFAEVEMVSSP